MELKNHLFQGFVKPLDYPPSNKREWLMKFLIFGVVLEMATTLVFFKYIVFSDTSSYALAANTLAITTHPTDMTLGPVVEQFTKELKNIGFEPNLIMKMKRTSFSAEGVLVGIGDDNIQVFEYPDHDIALENGNTFVKRFLVDNSLNKWKDVMHVYVKGNLVVFYMGRDKKILDTFNKNKDMNFLALNNPEI